MNSNSGKTKTFDDEDDSADEGDPSEEPAESVPLETHKLFAKNIPIEATPRDMEKFFAGFGRIATAFVPVNQLVI